MTSFHLLSLLALFACQPRSEPAPDAACEAAAASLQAWLEQLAEEGSAGPIEPPEGLVLVEAEVPWLTKTGLALTATLDTESVTLADMSAPVSEAASVFAAGPERPATLAKPDQGFLLAVDEGTPWSSIVAVVRAMADAGAPRVTFLFARASEIEAPAASAPTTDALVEACPTARAVLSEEALLRSMPRPAVALARDLPPAWAACGCPVESEVVQAWAWQSLRGSGQPAAGFELALDREGVEIELTADVPWKTAHAHVLGTGEPAWLMTAAGLLDPTPEAMIEAWAAKEAEFTWDRRGRAPLVHDESLSAATLNDRGMEAYEARDMWAAVKWFRASIDRDPDFALAHYNLACVMALRLPRRGLTCVEGGREEVLWRLARATELDPGRKTRMLEDEDLVSVRDLLAFRVIAGADPDDPEVLARLLTLAPWHAPPVGAFGSGASLRFQTDGTFTVVRDDQVALVNEGIHRSTTSHGTWKLEGRTLRLLEDEETTELTVEPSGELAADGNQILWTQQPEMCDA